MKHLPGALVQIGIRRGTWRVADLVTPGRYRVEPADDEARCDLAGRPLPARLVAPAGGVLVTSRFMRGGTGTGGRA